MQRAMTNGFAKLAILIMAELGLRQAVAMAQEERFVPPAQLSRPALVEVQPEATVPGTDILLKQIARWPEADGPAMAQAADLIIARIPRGKTEASVDIEQITATLEDAGVNLAMVHFRGARSVKVTRGGEAVPAAPAQAPVESPARPAETPTASSIRPPALSADPGVAEPATSPDAPRTLREILLAELAERFSLPAETFQLRFSPASEKLANLSEPAFRFQVQPRRQRNIGDMAWDVTITGDGTKQPAAISAQVRAWQPQVVAAKPIAYKQVLGDDDMAQRRILVDRLPDDVPLTRAQAIGQQAARDIATGTIMNARMLEPVQMVRVGELVNVLVDTGRIQIKWVAEARETGAMGQIIRIRKPLTREEFDATVTGPQQCKLIGPAGETRKLAARNQ